MEQTKIPGTHEFRMVSLPPESIVPDPGQPRKTFLAAIHKDLVRSLQARGQITPIVVRPGSEGKHIIVLGERRWRAAKDAGLDRLLCIVRDDIGEQEAREMQLAENYLRNDILPLEQAQSFKEYLGKYGISESSLSRRAGIPKRMISQQLGLLRLPASVQDRIEAGEIGADEAAKIATLPSHQQEAVAEAVSSGQIRGPALDKALKTFKADPDRDLAEVVRQISSQQANNHAAQPAKPGHGIPGSVKDATETFIAGLVSITNYLGTVMKRKCNYLENQTCLRHSWPTRDEIPDGVGIPVSAEEPEPCWRVKPAPLFCGLCSWSSKLQEIDEDISDIYEKLDNL